MAIPQHVYRNKLACSVPAEQRSDGMTNILVALKGGDVTDLSTKLTESGVSHFIHPHSEGVGRDSWIVFYAIDDTHKVYAAIDAMP